MMCLAYLAFVFVDVYFSPKAALIWSGFRDLNVIQVYEDRYFE